MDRGPGAGRARRRQAWYAIGQRQKDLPPQSTQRLGCRRHVRGLADRRVLRSIADTQVSRRRSTMEDTADRAVCQTKDFTILSPLGGSFIAGLICSYREATDQRPEFGSWHVRAKQAWREIVRGLACHEKFSHGRLLVGRSGQRPLQAPACWGTPLSCFSVNSPNSRQGTRLNPEEPVGVGSSSWHDHLFYRVQAHASHYMPHL